jgi:hypothetical protein
LTLVSQWDSRLCWLVHCAKVRRPEGIKVSNMCTVGNVALGQIYGFHMSLWAEHLGLLEDLFKDRDMLECVLSE